MSLFGLTGQPVTLRRASATIFALTAMIPLLLFLSLLWRFELLAKTEVQVRVFLALVVALLGFAVFRRMVDRISALTEALRDVKPLGDGTIGQADLTVVPGIGSVTEIGNITHALGRMLEDLKSSTDRLEDLVFKLGALNEVAELAAKIPRVEDLLSHVLERTMRGVSASIGSIMLLDQERQTLRVAVARGRGGPSMEGTETRVGEGIAGHVVEIGEPVLAENIETDPRFSKLNDPSYGSGSFLSLPLRVGQQIIGVINLAGKKSVLTGTGAQPSFSNTDLQFLNTLTTHIAYAVENARLLEEARRSAERLQEVVEDQKLRLTLAQQQMVQAAKLSALGQLVAGVAHELNNPLTVLLANIEIIDEDIAQALPENTAAPMRTKLKKMGDAAESARRIVQGLLTFARRLPLDRQRLELPELVQKVRSITAQDLRLARIQVHEEVEPDLPAIWADGHQLRQVLLNLVTNAKEAMATVQGERRLDIALRRAASDRVRLVVKDTGPGIPAELLSTIFDPFVSTKGAAGTGLGLSVSYGIVNEHGGDIRVDSRVGAGTTFTVELPIGQSSPQTALPPATTAVSLADRRIIVLEDNPSIVDIIRDSLGEVGSTPLIFTSAEDALNGLSENVDAVVVNFHLPGMNGLEFCRAATRRRPGLVGRVVLITGGVLPNEAQELLERTDAKVLWKPFGRSQFLDTLRSVFEPKSPGTR